MSRTIETSQKIDMADMPVQHPGAPENTMQARARFFNSGNAFNVKLPPVPPRLFAETALSTPTTGFIPCDQSKGMDMSIAATTPLMLARYATIAPHETLTARFAATGAIWYVIRGDGSANLGANRFEWAAGDVFFDTRRP